MDDRKKRIIRFFALAYIIFGLSIAYLMFFNLGISITARTGSSSQELEITVKNSSIHLITSLDVFILDGKGFEKKILSIEALKPGEEKTVKISEEQAVNGAINLSAKAPYHLTVSKKIQIEKSSESNESTQSMKIEMDSPSKTFISTKTSITITICNLSSETSTARIESELDKKYFPNTPEAKTIALKNSECSEQKFELIPTAKGKTTIAFNIKTEKLNKRLEKEIEIIE